MDLNSKFNKVIRAALCTETQLCPVVSVSKINHKYMQIDMPSLFDISLALSLLSSLSLPDSLLLGTVHNEILF